MLSSKYVLDNVVACSDISKKCDEQLTYMAVPSLTPHPTTMILTAYYKALMCLLLESGLLV